MADPIASGVVASLAHPGGNVTGLSLAWGEGIVDKLGTAAGNSSALVRGRPDRESRRSGGSKDGERARGDRPDAQHQSSANRRARWGGTRARLQGGATRGTGRSNPRGPFHLSAPTSSDGTGREVPATYDVSAPRIRQLGQADGIRC